jgi:chromosome partitioning protein
MPPKSNERNARITAIANQKGGEGKTTAAHALVAGLTLNGYKTLAVDLDPQRNLTYTQNPETGGADIYALMKGKAGASLPRHKSPT